MSENRRVRPMTEHEKEIEKKPDCLWDPLRVHWCNHYEYPPSTKVCEICIARSLAEALEDKVGSEAMRYFIEYRKFIGENYVEKE